MLVVTQGFKLNFHTPSASALFFFLWFYFFVATLSVSQAPVQFMEWLQYKHGLLYFNLRITNIAGVFYVHFTFGVCSVLHTPQGSPAPLSKESGFLFVNINTHFTENQVHPTCKQSGWWVIKKTNRRWTRWMLCYDKPACSLKKHK